MDYVKLFLRMFGVYFIGLFMIMLLDLLTVEAYKEELLNHLQCVVKEDILVDSVGRRVETVSNAKGIVMDKRIVLFKDICEKKSMVVKWR